MNKYLTLLEGIIVHIHHYSITDCLYTPKKRKRLVLIEISSTFDVCVYGPRCRATEPTDFIVKIASKSWGHVSVLCYRQMFVYTQIETTLNRNRRKT
jgi:hypothetical protein